MAPVFLRTIFHYPIIQSITSCDFDVNNVQYKLEVDASLLSKWFIDNHMKLNDAKCHFMLSEVSRPALQRT